MENRVYPDDFVMCSQGGDCTVIDSNGLRIPFVSGSGTTEYVYILPEIIELSVSSLLARASLIGVTPENIYYSEHENMIGDPDIVLRSTEEIREKLILYIEAKNIRDYIINRDYQSESLDSMGLDNYSGYIPDDNYGRVKVVEDIIETEYEKQSINILDPKWDSEILENTSTFISDFRTDYLNHLTNAKIHFEKENIDQTNIINKLIVYVVALVYHIRDKDNILHIGIIFIIASFFSFLLYIFNIVTGCS
jgi:hypothetical protein